MLIELEKLTEWRIVPLHLQYWESVIELCPVRGYPNRCMSVCCGGSSLRQHHLEQLRIGLLTVSRQLQDL